MFECIRCGRDSDRIICDICELEERLDKLLKEHTEILEENQMLKDQLKEKEYRRQ